VRTGTRNKKRCAGNPTRFSSRTTAFARRVFPARYELIRKPKCVGKMETPATMWNSRFAVGFPRLAEILAGKTRKNNSGTLTSGSHNSPVRTSICANFVSLERRHRELSVDMLNDPFRAPKDLQNCPRKLGQKRVHAPKSRRIRKGSAWRIRLPRGRRYDSRGIITRRAA
jgi:hypothetical protein